MPQEKSKPGHSSFLSGHACAGNIRSHELPPAQTGSAACTNSTLCSYRSKADISPDEVVHKAATLNIFRDGEYYPIQVSCPNSVSGEKPRPRDLQPHARPQTLASEPERPDQDFPEESHAIISSSGRRRNLSDYYKFHVTTGNIRNRNTLFSTRIGFQLHFPAHGGKPASGYFFNENPVPGRRSGRQNRVRKRLSFRTKLLVRFVSTTSDVLFRTGVGQ